MAGLRLHFKNQPKNELLRRTNSHQEDYEQEIDADFGADGKFYYESIMESIGNVQKLWHGSPKIALWA